MNTTQKILISIVAFAVVIAGGLYWLSKPNTQTSVPMGGIENSLEEGSETEQTPMQGATQNTPQSSVGLWETFTLYLDAAKRNNVADLAKYTHALSDTCKDSKQQKECVEKMNAVYTVGSKLQKADFVNVWEDTKQGILSTELKRFDTDQDFGYTKSFIIFVKDASGNPKLVSLKPNEEWKVKRNPASTTAELEKSLQDMVKDSDMDGLTDQIERCIFPDNLLVISCVESNPNKRDSNDDGYWDGVGFLIEKK